MLFNNILYIQSILYILPISYDQLTDNESVCVYAYDVLIIIYNKKNWNKIEKCKSWTFYTKFQYMGICIIVGHVKKDFINVHLHVKNYKSADCYVVPLYIAPYLDTHWKW